ncbi:MAG: hypothetical protein IKU29_02445 [Parabacteroides sp.]|nr:hypothetical protein [Parabacteroides sp.]
MKSLTDFLIESLNIQITENTDQINSEKTFKEYAHKKFKAAFGDKYDEEQANKVIDGILNDYKEQAEAGEWGELVGVLNKSFAN